MSVPDATPQTEEELLQVLDARPELADGLRAGSTDALVEYFQLGGGEITSVTVRRVL